MKLYKRYGWAKRASAKLKWHRVDETAQGLFYVRAQTMEERAASKMSADILAAQMVIFAAEIPKWINSPSPLFRKLRRAR